ncbi:MAG: phosphate acyltransferase PlsX [Spirochaetes bacterium]|nr:phosphate acyltransferase PlsX [Spirochaetota bacterium]
MIAVDVMSGDNPPEAIIRGALKAVQELGVSVLLVGDSELIENYLKKIRFVDRRKVKIEHSSEVIGMHEVPTVACKKKKNASVMICTRLAGQKKAHGIFSPGNTGASLVSALMNIGRIEGVMRPGLVTYVPTLKGASILLDAGANLECTPEYLAQFAIMGEVFSSKVQKKKNPSVGILSVGEEKSKGNDLTLKTYEMLKDLDFNFVGNMEGYDIYDGDVDVIVCDGFLGNVVVKVTERVFKLTFEFVWQEIGYHLLQRIGFALGYPAIRKLNKKIDAREYGGAILLGLKGTMVVGHGNSDAVATYNGVRIADLMHKTKLNHAITERLVHFGLQRKGSADKE